MVHKLYSQDLLFGNGYQKMLEVFFRRKKIEKNRPESDLFVLEGMFYSYDDFPYTIKVEVFHRRHFWNTQSLLIQGEFQIEKGFTAFHYESLTPFSITYIRFRALIQPH